MMTGLHTIRKAMCKKCRTVVGWTYVSILFASFFQVFAYEQDQKYKEGKFIIEREYILKTPAVQLAPLDEEMHEANDDTRNARMAADRESE